MSEPANDIKGKNIFMTMLPMVTCEDHEDNGSEQKWVDYIEHEESWYTSSGKFGKGGFCHLIPECFRSMIFHLCLAEVIGYLGKLP